LIYLNFGFLKKQPE